MRKLFTFFYNIYFRLRGEVTTDILVKNGLKHGKNFDRHNRTIIDDSHPWLISFGDNVELAPRVHILAHDTSTNLVTGYTRLGLVNIGDNVFIGADSIVLPNVTIGDNVIIGAGSVVTRDIPSNSIAAGNPAKVICKYDDYVKRKIEEKSSSPIFDKSFTLRNKKFSIKQRDEMIKMLTENGGIGYVE